MKKLLLAGSVMFIFVIIQSCQKETAPDVAELRADKTQIELLDEYSIDSFVINSTEKWKISKPANVNWITLSTDSGSAGTTVVRVRVSPNSADSANTALLTIASTEDPVPPVTVKVIQAHKVRIEWIPNPAAKGGETVTIYGTGFSPTLSKNKVTINGIAAVVQTALTTMLKITVPAKAGSGPLIVAVENKADTADFIYRWVGVVTPFAGGEQGYQDGMGTAAKFYRPQGIAFDAADNLYVCDYNNNKIRKITPAAVVTTLPGRFPPLLSPSSPATDYNLPTGIAVKSDGTVYVVEYNADAVTQISTSGVVSILAGNNQSGFQNGLGSIASFYRPTDIVVDATGNIYVSDRDNLCIRKITTDAFVSTFVGGEWGYQDGTGLQARFNRPTSLAIDAQGNLFTTDYFNNRIRKIDPNRNVTTIAGVGGHGSTDGNGLTRATFTKPAEIAVASDGTLYVGQDDGDNEIRIIRPNGTVETIVAFINTVSGQPYEFSGIYGLAVSKTGVLYVADFYNNRICTVTYQ